MMSAMGGFSAQVPDCITSFVRKCDISEYSGNSHVMAWSLGSCAHVLLYIKRPPRCTQCALNVDDRFRILVVCLAMSAVWPRLIKKKIVDFTDTLQIFFSSDYFPMPVIAKIGHVCICRSSITRKVLSSLNSVGNCEI
jgi:hypothetical protein